jgi:hypothetical protein
MVAFDNTILSLLVFPDADLRQGSGGQKVEYARERVLGLVHEIEDAREQVAVPAPALSELLVTEGADVQDVLTTLRGSSFIRIESFDERAAVELAMRLREARKAGDQRTDQPECLSEIDSCRGRRAAAVRATGPPAAGTGDTAWRRSERGPNRFY